MQEERPVGDPLDRDPGEAADGLRDPLEVLGAGRLDRHVPDLHAGFDADDVDRAEQAAGVADRLGETRERARAVREVDAQRRAERGGEVTGRHVPTTPSAASAAISSSR